MTTTKTTTACPSPGTWIENAMSEAIRCPSCGRKIKPGTEHRYDPTGVKS